ncbi:Protein cwh43 [Sorochytrium milnesiophthora]
MSARKRSQASRSSSDSPRKAVRDEEPVPRDDAKPSVGNAPVALSPAAVIVEIFWNWQIIAFLAGFIQPVWYFPLWELEISGYEVCLLALVSPLLLKIGIIRRMVQASFLSYRHFVYFVPLVGTAVIDPKMRLTTVTLFGCIGILFWAQEMSIVFAQRAASTRRTQVAASWAVATIFNLVLRFAYAGANPVIASQPTSLEHWVYAAIGLLMLVGSHVLRTDGRLLAVSTVSKQRHGSTSALGFALGSLLFVSQNILYDPASVPVWSSTSSPTPYPDTLLAAFAQLLVLTGVVSLLLSRSVCYRLVGSACVTSGWVLAVCWMVYLFYYRGYASLASGILLNAFLLVVAFTTFATLELRPAQVVSLLSSAFATVVFLHLALVWTVAYKFVPLGWTLRERSGPLFAFAVVTINPLTHSLARNAFPLRFEQTLSTRFFKQTLAGLVILSALAFSMRFAESNVGWNAPKPYSSPESGIVTAAIWNIHHAIDNSMYMSEKTLAGLIDKIGIDVLALVETDIDKPTDGTRNILETLRPRYFTSNKTPYYGVYGPTPQDHTWGCTLLSKYPITYAEHYMLPSPQGELACAVHAMIDVHGTPVSVLLSHNGEEEDKLDRQLQTQSIAYILGHNASTVSNVRNITDVFPVLKQHPEYHTQLLSSNPTSPLHVRHAHENALFMGYVNTLPFGELYGYLTATGLKDIDPTDTDRWNEYIFYRGPDVERVAYAHVDRGTVSDTEMQTAKFRVTSKRTAASYEKSEARFPEELHAHNGGFLGHKYHVFPEGPRYF